MDIRRLQAFAKVYELRSFSRAGDELRLSQPTISAHIMALEEELGVLLFDRLGRTVLPTPAGDVLHRYCLRVFTELDHALADILALSKRVAGELIIGGSTIPAHYILPRLIGGFQAKHHEVRIELQGGDTASIAAKVAAGEIHFGIIGAPAAHTELVSLPMLEDALVLVGPATGARRRTPSQLSLETLCEQPWIVREPGSGTRQTLEQALGQAGKDSRQLRIVLQVHTSLAVLECVEAGIGIAAVSRLAAQPYIDRGTVAVLPDCGLDMKRYFYAIYHAKRYVFPALRLFLEHCLPRESLETVAAMP